MRQQIDNVFNDREERPLFYVESGSRLWGIASPDSDFDVRGFHLQSKRQYFDFRKHRDIIEVMDGDFDFVSYDIDKTFGLLAKSNPTVFEWVRANIVYLNELPDWITLQQDIISNFDFKALFHHYVSLSKGHINLMETDKKFTYKTAIYCIRGLLSAELATRRIIPKLLIDDLFDQFETENEILSIARQSLERKKQRTEKEEVLGSDKQRILIAVKDFTGRLQARAPEPGNNQEKLEGVLNEYAFNLKSTFYR